MKIEIDTKHDSRDELVHLATMLQAIAGSSNNRSFALKPKDIKRRQRNIFDDPAPSAGLMGMFDNPSPSQQTVTPAPQQSAPVSESQTADLFSIFGSSPSESPATQASRSNTTAYLTTEPEADKETTPAKEIMDGDDIIPY